MDLFDEHGINLTESANFTIRREKGGWVVETSGDSYVGRVMSVEFCNRTRVVIPEDGGSFVYRPMHGHKPNKFYDG
jgi:hypothetical protein